jgi:hypothetical protein
MGRVQALLNHLAPRTAVQIAVIAVVVKTLVMEEYAIQLYLVVPLVVPIDLQKNLELGKLVVIVVVQKFLAQAILLILVIVMAVIA